MSNGGIFAPHLRRRRSSFRCGYVLGQGVPVAAAFWALPALSPSPAFWALPALSPSPAFWALPALSPSPAFCALPALSPSPAFWAAADAIPGLPHATFAVLWA